MGVRLFFYFLTVIAILIVGAITISIICSALGYPLNTQDLMVCIGSMAVYGIGGSLVNLFASKSSVMRSMRVQLISQPENEGEKWLVDTIRKIADKKGLKMPDVGIYDAPEMNAFATGWNRDSALVAVSTGLLKAMNPKQVEAVLGHELSHVDNGDMVTLTLVQGVVNTFVLTFSSIAASIITAVMNQGKSQSRGSVSSGMANNALFYVMQTLFGFLGTAVVMWFSRYREYRADAGSADVLGKDSMISALEALKGDSSPVVKKSRVVKALCINSRDFGELFMTHPPLDKRIKALQERPN
ncbi:heat shock protein HtpX [Ruminobacter amylophilus]|uniref:Heat shock protein HtpX n=1 Tax=Ruminobacter amylophilus TaxID=867 RepID=A0A662ZFI7_9GAMM|nr:protease HtpX [Ruminobacter amylophilus]SFO97337.1 heat shock protein HtpX [Ruminobacter amylophilus]